MTDPFAPPSGDSDPPSWGTPPTGPPPETGGAPADPVWGRPPPGYGQGWGTTAPGYPPAPGFPPAPGYGPGYGPAYGQPQPPGAPPGWQAGGYARPTEGKATAALVCSIISFVVCPIVPAIIALVLAGQAQRSIAASGGWLQGADQVKAARIVSWIHLGLAGLALLVVSVALLIGLSTAAVDGTVTTPSYRHLGLAL